MTASVDKARICLLAEETPQSWPEVAPSTANELDANPPSVLQSTHESDRVLVSRSQAVTALTSATRCRERAEVYLLAFLLSCFVAEPLDLDRCCLESYASFGSRAVFSFFPIFTAT